MENAMQIFENPDFGKIRTLTINGEPWIAGRDVCHAFGDTTPSRSLGRIDDDDKALFTVETAGGPQEMTFINEAGLYSLLFAMQPEKANKGGAHTVPPSTQARIDKLRAFKHWVTHDVLPTIRKTGGYGNPRRVPDVSPAALARLLNTYERMMMNAGKTPVEICAMASAVSARFGVALPIAFTRDVPEQLCLFDTPTLFLDIPSK